MFHSIWWKLPQFDFRYCSVLTRILPWGVRGPPLLRNKCYESVWLIACTCALMGASSRLFYAPSQIFWGESCKAAACWEHWYWYSVKLGYQTLLSGKILPNPWLSSIRTLSKITETICLTVAAAVVHIVASLMKYNLKHNTIALKGWQKHETN